jgi:tetratricopeptide (TPR) repeat protein
MSDRELRFSVSIPKGTKYEPFPGSFEDGERHCLERLEATGSLDALNYLIQHYQLHGREDLARLKLEALIDDCTNLEVRALLYVYKGQSYERTKEWEPAIDSYRAALALEPCDTWTSYFTHNNLASCLSVLGRHAEAEPLCRLAIAVDPAHSFAHRNLGIALGGQGDGVGAARAWVEATRANAADGRALELLEQLVVQQPHVLEELPRLGVWLDECRRAVALAREMAEEVTKPKPRTSGPRRCEVCGEKTLMVESFGQPIDGEGRRRAVLICAGCGKQSLAVQQTIDPDEASEALPAEPAALADSTAPTDPAPSKRPPLGAFLKDLFWLSLLCLIIADASGLLGHLVAPVEHRLDAANVWLLGLLAIFALVLISSLTSVRNCVLRVWSALRWYWRAFLSWRP